ncbi:hypothetical protein [Pigmentiphaga litoralis]|uniref:hypothetical protein n=1 Tax=Pigmentiphaga litoralis TaxID=516702 RepID=UPI003B42C0AA
MILPDIARTFPPAQIPVRPEWLAQVNEGALDAALPIVDAHHHLWDRPGQRYLFDDFLADTRTGHNIVGSVFIQCRSMYRPGVEHALSPVGETEFANGVAAQSASGLYGPLKACAGIVGFADLTLGAAVRPVLQAHLRAAPDRFKGVRNMTAADASPDIAAGFGKVREGMLREPAFWKGFAELAPWACLPTCGPTTRNCPRSSNWQRHSRKQRSF